MSIYQTNGKGSKPRKFNKKRYDDNWDFYLKKRICKQNKWLKVITKKDIKHEE